MEQTLEPVEVQYQLASRWRRFVALMIDSIPYMAGLWVYLLLRFPHIGISPVDNPELSLEQVVEWRLHRTYARWYGYVLLGILIGAFDSRWVGQSLGKRIMGIQVVDANTGLPLPPPVSIMRAAYKLFTGWFGWLWSLGGSGLMLHDRQFQTVVVAVKSLERS